MIGRPTWTEKARDGRFQMKTPEMVHGETPACVGWTRWGFSLSGIFLEKF